MKMLDIFLCGPTVNAVCISCMCFKRIIHSIFADFALEKLPFFAISYRRYPGNEMASEDVSTSRMRVKDLSAICD